MESTKREWFTSFYVGERIHSDVEAQARSKDVVALIDFDDWKNNRMPSNPDFGTRNRSMLLILIFLFALWFLINDNKYNNNY